MELLTSEHVQRVLEILKIVAMIGGLVATIRVCRGWFTGGLALTRKRKLKRLQKRRDHLELLHDSEREYYGWLLSGVLWVLWLLALQLAVEGLTYPPKHWSLELQLVLAAVVNFMRTILGIVAYMVATTWLADYRALRRFDRTMANLDRAIAKLEAKMSLQTAPAGA
jgi:hypothetical protein